MSEPTIVLQVCRDFLIPGCSEPLELAPPGAHAIHDAIEAASILEDLIEGLEDALLLAYSLEGKGDSPGAASAIRRAISESPIAMSALGIEGGSASGKQLRARGKRIARRRTQATARPRKKIDPR